jgi:thioredoxin-like negative regulator of GroEL
VSTAAYGSRAFWWTPKEVLQPPETTKQGNRIYLPIRFENELEDLLLIKRPILLNFTIRGDPYCNKVTGALQRIIAYETDKRVNMVDVECDEPGTRDLLPRFGVKNIPSVVAVRKGLPVSKYVDQGLLDNPDSEVDWQKLKQWIEENADVD